MPTAPAALDAYGTRCTRKAQLRCPYPAAQDAFLVNGAGKTNVCFAAACFSLAPLHYIKI